MRYLRHILVGLALSIMAVATLPVDGIAHEGTHPMDCVDCPSMASGADRTDVDDLTPCHHGALCIQVALPASQLPVEPLVLAVSATAIGADIRPNAPPVRNDVPPPRT